GTTREKFSKVQEVPLPSEEITVGVPADLIRQRPDIRRAERQLAAQVARIGVATSQLYPALSLNGSFNYASTDFSDLFDRPSRAFSFGPSLSWSVFQGGKIESLIRKQDAAALQQYYSYQQVVLNAVNETENAMTAYIEQLVQFEAQKRAMMSARRSFKLSTSLYKQGLIDFTRVLDSQIALLQTETSVAAARGNTAINLVNLYRAMGGGWDYNQPVALTINPEKIKENELKSIIKSELDNEK
ncbi:MAG: TolC family protein, partial [Lentisphaeria bacterium]